MRLLEPSPCLARQFGVSRAAPAAWARGSLGITDLLTPLVFVRRTSALSLEGKM